MRFAYEAVLPAAERPPLQPPTGPTNMHSEIYPGNSYGRSQSQRFINATTELFSDSVHTGSGDQCY